MGRTLPSLHLSSCSFAHAAGEPLFADVDLDVGPGWHGVVGANGAGKSTLLDLVAGLLAPTQGSVQVIADRGVVLCRQAETSAGPDVASLAGRWDGAAASLRARLDLEPHTLADWTLKSPGERRRWQVAAAIARDADVLLLDEPTNHLDGDARAALVAELRRFRGLGLVVSHDRTLLEELTTRTLRVADGAVTTWAGSYAEASSRWAAEEAATQEQHQATRREVGRLTRELGNQRRRRQDLEQQSRAKRRGGQPDDREAGRKVAAASAERSVAARVRAVGSRVERAEHERDDIVVRRRLGGDVRLAEGRGAGRDWVVRADLGSISVQERPLVIVGEVGVRPGEHVRVHGANGSGKTTLVRALVAAARDQGREVGVLDQEVDDRAWERARTNLDRLDRDRRGWVLATIANLGVSPDRVLTTTSPSPGEARKLALALILHQSVELVVLDEPTNHLDLPSIERLQAALAAYAGSLILVTHDDRLAAACCDITWQIRDGMLDHGVSNG